MMNKYSLFMRRVSGVFAAAICLIGLTACSGGGGPLGGSAVDENHRPGLPDLPSVPFTPRSTKDAEFVSSSQQGKLTLTSGRYKLNATLGSPGDKLQNTTARGYKVYGNVQGQVLTE